MKNDLITFELEPFVFKAFIPMGDGPFEVLLLNHGWTGDENSMWIFATQLFPNKIMIAPRALQPSNHPKFGGYSWVKKPLGDFSTLDDFMPSLTALHGVLDKLAERYPQGDFSAMNIAGFSQGAALSYVFALLYPERVKKLAGLAGFMPKGSEVIASKRPLVDTPILIAHGTQDQSVPFEMAEEAEKILTSAGGLVQFCQSDVGHKLGANCMRSFKEFMRNRRENPRL